MQSVGRHIVRSGLSSEVLNQSKNVGVRSLGSAKPDPAADPAKERQAKKVKGLEKKATHSKSFVQNMFRGMIQSEQAFPFPKVLDEEQAENLAMLVEPTEKFMTEVNDPAWNDTNETVHTFEFNAIKTFGLSQGLGQRKVFLPRKNILIFNDLYLKI